MLKLAVALKMFGTFWGFISGPEYCVNRAIIPDEYSASPRVQASDRLIMRIGKNNNAYQKVLKNLVYSDYYQYLQVRDSAYNTCAVHRENLIQDAQDLSLIGGCQCALNKKAPADLTHDCSMFRFKDNKRKDKNSKKK